MLGTYRVLSTLGSGGMGVVYAAWDTRLERKVALKMIRGHLLSDEAVRRRFLREAKVAARVEHPNVVRVYRLEPIGDDLAIEMECIEGSPLSTVISGSPLPLGHVLNYMEQVLTALVACHEQGVIHCDLKPGNLLITPDEKVYLADFGIARALDLSAPEGATLATRTGPFWGTPRYSPPEAWEDSKPNFLWDLYALGVVMYEALTAESAFDGNTPAAVMRQVILSTPTPIGERRPDVSLELAALIADMMDRDPAQRPPSAEAALERLQGLPEYNEEMAETLPMERMPPTTRARKATQRTWWIAAAASLLVALALTVFVGPFETPHVPEDESEARVVTDVHPDIEAIVAELPQPEEFTPTSHGAHFVYDDGIHGPELWHIDVSGKMGMVMDIVPGPVGSHPRRLFHIPNSSTVLFAAQTPTQGEELWLARKHGPDVFHVDIVRDIIPGPMGSEPWCFSELNGFVLFYATTLDKGRELWMTNTREQQTALVEDIFPGRNGSAMMTPKVTWDAKTMYFMGLKSNEYGQFLFEYEADTYAVKSIAEMFDDAGPMSVMGDSVFLAHRDEIHGTELWVYRKGGEDIQFVADLLEGPDSSNPDELFTWQDTLVFRATSREAGTELWISDGTAQGTRMLLDINPGVEGANPYGFIDAGDLLFFRATDSAHGTELWMTDGTPGGTMLVADIWEGPESADPYSIVATEDRVFFTAREPEFGEELYCYHLEGKTVERLSDFWPGPGNAEPYEFRVVNDHIGMFRLKLSPGVPAVGSIKWSEDPPLLTVWPLPTSVSVSEEEPDAPR